MVAVVAGGSFYAGVKAEHGHDFTMRVRAAWAGGSYADIQRDWHAGETLQHPGNAQVPCPAISSKTLVLFAIGQSNAANYVAAPYTASPKVTAFFNGKCFKAADPLPGASGDRGSVWSRVADRMVKSGRYSNAVISVAAIGDTSVRQWAPNGTLNSLIVDRMQQMQSAGIKPSAVIFQQGEHDGPGNDGVAYQKDLSALLRQIGSYGGRTFVALASGCGTENASIREAQRRAATSVNASIGVDMDQYRQRVNLCHLSGESADKIAAEWGRML